MPLVRKSPGDVPQETPRRAAAEVLQELSSASEEVRWNAARAAAGVEDGARALAAALRVESVPRVREAMFTSLARMGDAAGVAAVLPLLRSDDAKLRAGALDALKVMIRGAQDLLPPLLEDADVDVRVLSCELARALPGEAATSLLCHVLRREQDLNVCAAAVDVLAEVGQPDALPALAECGARFGDAPFLAFAIQVAADRIGDRPAHHRG
jgi:hypothetical protein